MDIHIKKVSLIFYMSASPCIHIRANIKFVFSCQRHKHFHLANSLNNIVNAIIMIIITVVINIVIITNMIIIVVIILITVLRPFLVLHYMASKSFPNGS